MFTFSRLSINYTSFPFNNINSTEILQAICGEKQIHGGILSEFLCLNTLKPVNSIGSFIFKTTCHLFVDVFQCPRKYTFVRLFLQNKILEFPYFQKKFTNLMSFLKLTHSLLRENLSTINQLLFKINNTSAYRNLRNSNFNFDWNYTK